MKIKQIAKTKSYQIYCPGCNEFHNINCDPDFGGWKIETKNESKLTVVPELRIPNEKGKTICRFSITNGNIIFGNDCSHKLSGKTVEVPDFKNSL